MKMKLLCVCAGLALAAAPCLAAGPSWDGTWKLNVAKSKMTGDTFTIEAKGNMMHSSNGVLSFDFACDGKSYTTIANYTMTCTGSPAAGYDYVDKAGDKVTSKFHRALSADGNTLTDHGTEIRPDGTKVEFTEVSKRQSGTSGLVGKWMNVKTQAAANSFTVQTKGDSIKVYSPEYKTTVEGKMDGSQLAVTGPTVPPGVTESFKQEGANKLHYVVQYKGKAMSEGIQTLSADGKSCVDEEWTAGKPNEKQTYFFERQ